MTPRKIVNLAIILLVSVLLVAALFMFRNHLPYTLAERIGLRHSIDEIRAARTPALHTELSEKGLKLGAPAFLRIFKETSELELYLYNGTAFELFKTYPICAYSGQLGPKLKEGDRQAPEGFYHVTRSALNPRSSYHLSFNLGFPNAFDRAHGRTGSFLMVHGACVSIGCYAMTDPLIEEIYLIVEAALRAGQSAVPVHAFPFRMTNERLEKAKGHPSYAFWANLAPAYEAFATSHHPPQISVENKRYIITP